MQTIDRLKRGALEQNKKARVDKMMRGLASPKSWSLMNGRTVSVHTPLTTRARELMHLYHGLTLPLLRIQERLDVLLHVKWTVKEFDCNLTREIVDLVCSSGTLSFCYSLWSPCGGHKCSSDCIFGVVLDSGHEYIVITATGGICCRLIEKQTY